MMTNDLVLALGNPLRGDDGIGAAVLAALRADDLPPQVTLLDGGTAGLELVLLMQGYTRVIIIDAAAMAVAPGTWRRFSAAALRSTSGDLAARVTVHYAGLAEALALGDALGLLPPSIIIFGIQPQSTDWEIGLSPVVAAAIPAVCAALRAELAAAPAWLDAHMPSP